MSHEVRGAAALWDARNGRPTLRKAAGQVATFTVIPAAIVGIAVGTQLVAPEDSAGRLFAVCGGCALAFGFGSAFLTWGVYKLFGFRPLVFLADTLLGGFVGFFLGGALWTIIGSGWAMILCPLLAVVVPNVAPRPRLDDDKAVTDP